MSIISLLDPPPRRDQISTIMGEALLVQILLGHFAYIQFECFRIPKITVFELTQIECLQFRFCSSRISVHFECIQFWSSTLCIPVNDSDALLDISSAANGADSTVPLGTWNRPATFPGSKGLRSVYWFDPDVFCGSSSWDDLHSMLKSAVSRCNISVHKSKPPNSLRKHYYIMGCDHSRLYQQKQSWPSSCCS